MEFRRKKIETPASYHPPPPLPDDDPGEGVDIAAAARQGIPVANVPTATSGNADSVAEMGIYLMIGSFN
ncbi:hypothetical protein [Desulfosarcina ovata]|uniref:D-isomer specific 2-hydroxyacid dehydrogenase catalytic domain-containing protein n=1 Tax=Desulfosarcina ovata subsp. ovata TaxID=2752305 RepID=A0A5K8ACD9_9BACT|nr:hypothetical protein [Desulfosarcina ovata]BBO90176.1 hypothetical protein DSCOOX_33560 [Desulfosarcina ovata subsp. ovata]